MKSFFKFIKKIFYYMSMLFGVSNLGKSIDEMNKDSINKSWLQVGSNLREAYNNTKQKYNYNET